MQEAKYFSFQLLFSIAASVFVFSALIAGIPELSFGQAPAIQWQRCLGGSDFDQANSIVQTNDGGFAVAGWTKSTDDSAAGNHGGYDAMVAKLRKDGSVQWEKCYGGPGYDQAYSIIQTADSGFAFAGVSGANGGDVSGYHGGTDAWVVKLDSNGNVTWQKCVGGTLNDVGNCIIQTNGGGYAVAGYTGSTDSDVVGNHGLVDAWVFILDANGNLIEQRCLGGSSVEQANSIVQIAGGGFAVAGYTSSNDSDVSGLHGIPTQDKDVWIVKLKQNITDAGAIEWAKCFGGTEDDVGISIMQTHGGALVFAGYTDSQDSDLAGIHSIATNDDYWVVKLDLFGNKIWSKCYGGTRDEQPHSIIPTTGGGIAVAGYTTSQDSDVVGNHGFGGLPSYDYWLIQLDSNGVLDWQKCLGTSGTDQAASVIQCSDKGFALAGYIEPNFSPTDGDAAGVLGGQDMWVVRLDSAGAGGGVGGVNEVPTSLSGVIAFPNPTSGKVSMHYVSTGQLAVHFELRDELGRILQSAGNNIVSQSNESLDLDLSDYPCGIYFYSLHDGNGIQTGTISLIK